jgi:hypothetical protein
MVAGSNPRCLCRVSRKDDDNDPVVTLFVIINYLNEFNGDARGSNEEDSHSGGIHVVRVFGRSWEFWLYAKLSRALYNKLPLLD